MTFLKYYRNSFLVSPSDRRDSWFGCERLYEMPCEMFPYVSRQYYIGVNHKCPEELLPHFSPRSSDTGPNQGYCCDPLL